MVDIKLKLHDLIGKLGRTDSLKNVIPPDREDYQQTAPIIVPSSTPASKPPASIVTKLNDIFGAHSPYGVGNDPFTFWTPNRPYPRYMETAQAYKKIANTLTPPQLMNLFPSTKALAEDLRVNGHDPRHAEDILDEYITPKLAEVYGLNPFYADRLNKKAGFPLYDVGEEDKYDYKPEEV